MIRSAWRQLRMAVALLTRVPVGYPEDARDEDVGPSAACYPIVGALVGGVTLAAYYGAGAVWDGPALPSVVALVAWIAITGGLHVDGLMDACDGLLSHRPREEKLRIMKDPQVGAFGALGLAGVLLVKLGALASLPWDRVWWAMLLAPVVGRLSMVYAGAAFPYARAEGGMGGSFAGGTGWRHFAVAVALTLAAVAAVREPRAWACLAVVAVCVWWVARRIARSLGGMTGDTYGALCEVTEAFALLAFGAAIP
ncbi:adenosylcobinamide-GDP ribazoletransferase [Candidatus Poribacteria bacterium]|nr:adenosylcobinamide-GDP ribazoletransferase [Candidatus Poribacteria bacterium]